MNHIDMTTADLCTRLGRATRAGCLLLFLAAAAFAEETPPAPVPDTGGYDSFRAVVERNIFNAGRQKPPAGPPVQEAPAPRIIQLTLIGTMITEASSYAFFAGTEPEFNGVRELGGQVAGHAITSIRSDGVSLGGEGQVIFIAVGKGLRRQETGAWEPSTGMDFVSRPGPSITQNRRSAEESGRGDFV
ncbi:MAG: hypothetical protein ACE15F_18600, partial [bacterium]